MKQYLPLLTIMALLVACKQLSAEQKNNATDKVSEQQQKVYENDYLVTIGDYAPDFSLPLTNGEIFTLSEQHGKIIMLQFTASWCGVCRREMPYIEKEIWQRHNDKPDFVLVGIDREESADIVSNYTTQVGITYPMALDENAEVFALYAVRGSGITRNVLIDRNGCIIKQTRLFNEQEFNGLVTAIDSLLAK